MATKPIAKNLDDLTVADIMADDVVTIRDDAAVTDLIRLLDHEQVHGVPVLDSRARLLGVVSATDVLRIAAHAPEIDIGLAGILKNASEPGRPSRASGHKDPAHTFFEDSGSRINLHDHLASVSDSIFDDYTVSDIMTPATLTVRAEATVRELAQFLARGHIHRALVVADNELLGIVSAFDIVRAVAAEPED